MKKLLRALKQWTLLIAIIIGAAGHSFFSQFAWMTPWLLASMLLITYSNISPKDLRFHPLHIVLLAVQIAASILLYGLLVRWNAPAAQAAGMCILAPTATSAAIITGMLGGSIAFIAAYTFISNLAAVVLAPLLLPLIAPGHADLPFFETMRHVFMRVGPTMLLPLLIDWGIQRTAPRVHAVLLRWGILSYYLWAGMLIILMASTFDLLLAPGRTSHDLEIALALTALAVCAGHFIVGKSLGSLFHRRIAGGQALAQKNTILPLWLAFQYLDPIVSVSLAAYSVFQNIANATQLWLKGRRDDRILERLHDFHEARHALRERAAQLQEQEEQLADLPPRLRQTIERDAAGERPHP